MPPIAFILLIFILHQAQCSQAQQTIRIKEIIEVALAISKQDSLKRHSFTSSYDSIGRLIHEQKYFYHRQNARLIKEEIRRFDSNSQILHERIIQYPENTPSTQKKLETKYILYTNQEAQNKRLWRKLWDDYGDIEKEDTLSYNADTALINKCSYDYRGNTSLYCHDYSYNIKGQMIRWKTYYKWTTIDTKGRVANKQAKRRDYRYKYNKKGLLKASFGKYYLHKYRQKIRYNKDLSLKDDKTVSHKKINYKDPKSGRIKKKKTCEKKWLLYQDGILVKERQLRNNKEQKQTEKQIKNGLVVEEKHYKNEKINETFINSYKNGILTKNIHIKYNGKEKERYRIISLYNAEGNPLKEVQMIGNKQLSVYNYQYGSKGLLQSKSLSLNNGETLEKTTYIYKLY